eukprot:4936251-Alexandrium_andersonii.AAC.1
MVHRTGFRTEIALLGPGEFGCRSGRCLGRSIALTPRVRSLTLRVTRLILRVIRGAGRSGR